MSAVVAEMLVIRLVGEAGLFELGVLAAVVGVLPGGVPRLGCSLGMRSDKHRVLTFIDLIRLSPIPSLLLK